MSKLAAIKLSICIATRNRAAFIGATLDSILGQTTSECEIVISDNASTDDTGRVVAQYAQCSAQVRYVRQEKNHGFDCNFDLAVQLARGEYCWLMADDDLLKPGAIAAVLAALRRDWSLVVVNVEGRNFDLTRVVQRRWMDLTEDRVYGAHEMERLFVEASPVLKYVGCFIIKRSIWLARDRERYYGSWFIFIGAVFQERLPGESLVIAEPLVIYRKGNAHTYSSEYSEIWFSNLPSVVASLTTVSAAAKDKFWRTEPWKSFRCMWRLRALGVYSLAEYRRWVRPKLTSVRERVTPTFIALLPGALINSLSVLYHAVTRRYQGVWQPEMELEMLKESRFYFRNWRVLRRDP